MMTTESSANCTRNLEVIPQAPNFSRDGPPGERNSTQNRYRYPKQHQNHDQNEELENVIRYRCIGDTFKICQVNVEGLSRDKTEFLSKLLAEEAADVLMMQETKKSEECRLIETGNIKNFNPSPAELILCFENPTLCLKKQMN